MDRVRPRRIGATVLVSIVPWLPCLFQSVCCFARASPRGDYWKQLEGRPSYLSARMLAKPLQYVRLAFPRPLGSALGKIDRISPTGSVSASVRGRRRCHGRLRPGFRRVAIIVVLVDGWGRLGAHLPCCARAAIGQSSSLPWGRRALELAGRVSLVASFRSLCKKMSSWWLVSELNHDQVRKAGGCGMAIRCDAMGCDYGWVGLGRNPSFTNLAFANPS